MIYVDFQRAVVASRKHDLRSKGLQVVYRNDMKSEDKESARKCSYCNKQFKYKSEKKRHEQSHTPQFECKVCKKKFSFLSALRRHEKQHERVGDVYCTECNHKFRDETLLKRHMKYAHKGTFVCSKCGTKLNSEVALRTHMKTHKPVSERRFRCNFDGCNKSFNFPHHLKHHVLTHTNTKQYFCDTCSKGFIQLHHLKTHLKSHDSGRFQCTVPGCNKEFTNEYARKRHLATHSIDSGISSDSNSGWEIFDIKTEESSKCLSCGQVIAKDLLKDHNIYCRKDISNSPIQQFNHINLSEISNTVVPQDLTTKVRDADFEVNDIRSCKSFLGGCIVSAIGEVNENCLCAQITPTTPKYHLTPNESIDPPQSIQNATSTFDMNANKVTIRYSEGNGNNCDGCECGLNLDKSTKDFAPAFILVAPKSCTKKRDLPELEYRMDGTIKIKETFDADILDIAPIKDKDEVKRKFLPFNSCEMALGKCIVSETGMISEGCLCAKMAFAEDVNAEEIDEITPQPTVY